jgi:hypothetical protein
MGIFEMATSLVNETNIMALRIFLYPYHGTKYHLRRRGGVLTEFGWGILRERDHLGDLGVDGRIILRWIFREWDEGHGLDRSATVAGTCECGNEPSGSIK